MSQPNFGVLDTDAPALEAPGWDTPFRFAILGDFSGRANRSADETTDEIRERHGHKIDRENFDEVLGSLNVGLDLDLKGGKIEMAFGSLDDFHPDEFVPKVERFDDCSTAKEKAALLSQILHHPDFQALEATWRGLDWFLRKAWTSENGVEILVYDLSRAEFELCLNGDDDLTHSPLYHWLVEKAMQGYNAQPWGALIGLFDFEQSADAAQLLGRMARIARSASAPFLTGIAGKVWEKTYKLAKDDAEAWESLRAQPEAALLGLACPGFLVRPPYGAGTKPIDKFAYEEYVASKTPPKYLFANAGLACGALLAKSFTKKNWSFKPGADLALDGMAMHVTRDADDEEVLTTVGAWFAQPIVDKLVKQGFMPLRGVKGKNSVELARFLPVSSPPKELPAADLVGSWGQKALKGVPRTPTKMKVGDFGIAVATAASDGGVSVGKRGGGKAKSIHDDPDAQDAAVDALEAEIKAAKEAAEGGSSSSDPFASDSSSSDPFASDPFASDSPSETPSDVDPELAALMAGGDSPAEPAATEEMDPELAALMAGTESPPAEPAATEEMDPELAALLKQMEGN